MSNRRTRNVECRSVFTSLFIIPCSIFICSNPYHGNSAPKCIYFPVGPSASNNANATDVLAPSSTSMGAASEPRSVFTQSGCAEFTLMGVSSEEQGMMKYNTSIFIIPCSIFDIQGVTTVTLSLNVYTSLSGHLLLTMPMQLMF